MATFYSSSISALDLSRILLLLKRLQFLLLRCLAVEVLGGAHASMVLTSWAIGHGLG